MKKIFIVEDDSSIREELMTFLKRYGYEVEGAIEFENIVSDIVQAEPHLILLDVNLPVFDGYYICKELRKQIDTPIIIVTSRNSDMDELMSMNLGADDFITKPYNTEILLARISAILKRSYNTNSSNILEYKELKLNLESGTINYKGTTEELTKNELKILSCLIKNKGKIISRDELMEALWQSDLFVDDNTLSVNVTRLRRKLEDIGLEEAIETRRGLGYIMP